MLRSETIRRACHRQGPGLAMLVMLVFFGSAAGSQTAPESPYYSRGNAFGFLAAYSNNSSHMLLGVAENRKLFNFGASYSRRLFQNRIVNWQYNAEILPVALESDPVDRYELSFTAPTVEGPFPQTITPGFRVP